MKKETINDKLKVRSAYNKGKRVGYAEGDSVEQDRINAIRNNRAANRSRGRDEANQIPNSAPAPSAAPTPSAAPVSVTPPATSVTPPAATTTENTTTPTTSTTPTTPQDQSTGVDDVTPVQTPPPEQTPFDPGFGNVQPGEYSDEQKPDATGAMKRATPVSMADPATKSAFDIGREYRVLRTGAEAEEMARGVLPDTIPKIPDPKKIDRADTEITPEQAAELQMQTTQEARAATLGAISPEQVSTIDEVSKAAQPEPFKISTIGADDVSKVPENAVIDAAVGFVSPEVSETLARAAGVQATPIIDSAEVQVIPGALQERVIGSMTSEAKAVAAKVAGTSLAKITRAKKQLRNAGLSEEDITELGNDPETLEARLTDFTEDQRGIVEGIPEEALVSNQIDSLLNGIEEGKVPTWAGPAVASVEAMLAQRGMSASTVGRDALLNAIITSALPIAQGNAQAIQQSVTQQKSIEATNALKDAEMSQQTALFNAQNVFQLDMAQFSADQQRSINNSKFLQTASLQNATMAQQGVMQDAVLMSQRNLAEADQNTKHGITNAQAFLQMDLTNLSNEQQTSVLKAQQTQQRLLSNQAASNAALQFNATNENQVNQFMTSVQQQNEQFNANQLNSMEQFNAAAENSAEARRVANELQVETIEAQLATDVSKFNSQQDFAREQFNVQNATVIAQSNVEWRRKANTADTAAFNAINQQNAQNSFNLTSAANNFLWQELRDEADFSFKRWDGDQQRKASLLIAALGNEAGVGKQDVWDDSLNAISSILEGWLD